VTSTTGTTRAWGIGRILGRGLAPALAVAGGLALSACSSGGRVSYRVGVDRDTPQATYEFFKSAAASKAFEDEWLIFSPNFKRALNQAVGRNVDFGDYTLARNTVATNSQADMQLLLNSTLTNVQMIGPDTAVLTVSGGGQAIRPRMVRLTSWELRLKGDPQPYTDLIANAESVRPSNGGGIEVVIPASAAMAPLLRSIRPEQIESLQVESRWYVDDFGGLEGAVGGGVAEPQPAAPTGPTQPSTLPPPPAGGYGSPDG
jgi:hypothetical protein